MKQNINKLTHLLYDFYCEKHSGYISRYLVDITKYLKSNLSLFQSLITQANLSDTKLDWLFAIEIKNLGIKNDKILYESILKNPSLGHKLVRAFSQLKQAKLEDDAEIRDLILEDSTYIAHLGDPNTISGIAKIADLKLDTNHCKKIKAYILSKSHRWDTLVNSCLIFHKLEMLNDPEVIDCMMKRAYCADWSADVFTELKKLNFHQNPVIRKNILERPYDSWNIHRNVLKLYELNFHTDPEVFNGVLDDPWMCYGSSWDAFLKLIDAKISIHNHLKQILRNPHANEYVDKLIADHTKISGIGLFAQQSNTATSTVSQLCSQNNLAIVV